MKMGGDSEKRKRGLNLVFEDKESTYFEIEKLVDSRIQDGRVEYLVKWKGVSMSQATWEPSENLCDSAIEEASKLMKKKKLEENLANTTNFQSHGNSSATCSLTPSIGAITVSDADGDIKKDKGGGPGDANFTEAPKIIDLTEEPGEEKQKATNANANSQQDVKHIPQPCLEDGQWYWTDEEQIKFREPDRINVNTPDAKQKITDARLSGTPVVLVGHVGWANFAKKWLIPSEGTINNETLSGPDDVISVETSNEVIKNTANEVSDKKSDWLDLSLSHKLDINQMIDDIGKEMVPLLQENYNEHDPLQSKAQMTVQTFLKTYWPSIDGRCFAQERLYLHQWQFPLSHDGGMKLCHKNNPLPKNIYGDDLLKYWLDLPQCKYDNPLQYLFMGRDGTMSKLHCDNGGLDISIAPIVGEFNKCRSLIL